jgi:putative transposase
MLHNSRKYSVEICVYCLLAYQPDDGLRLGSGETHRRCSRMINFRETWRGHLWQSRFASFQQYEK